MPYPRLRVFCGPEEQCDSLPTSTASHVHTLVSVSLGEILPALIDAVRNRRTWLRDFSDDQVTISSDLYEVLRAYSRLRRPPAA